MGYLVASAYNVVFVNLDKRMSIIYLPLRTEAPSNPKLICTSCVNRDHYIQVFLWEGAPLPLVTTYWKSFREECAAEWKDIYRVQLDMYVGSIGISRTKDSKNLLM